VEKLVACSDVVGAFETAVVTCVRCCELLDDGVYVAVVFSAS